VDTYQFIASVASSLSLPLAVVIVAFIFRRQIGSLLGRIRKLDALGTHTEFDPDDAAPAVVEAAAKASEPSGGDVTAGNVVGSLSAPVAVQFRGLFAQARSLIQDEPRQAVGIAYRVVDDVLRTYMSAAGVPPGGSARESIELSRKAGLISSETATAMTSLLGQRNLAMHNHPDDVSAEDAATYVTLADSVAFSIQADRHRLEGSGNASGEGTRHESS
jgi:hypothetical protein